MLNYPATLTEDNNGTFLVTFADIPEATSVGDTAEDALREALDGLESALDFYFTDRRPVPAPSKPAKGQPVVTLPALVTAKVLLHNEMVTQGVRKAELARRMDLAPPAVERIFDIKHGTKIETIEAALGKLGKHFDLRVA
jgi:antitoxin HicB